MVRAILRAEASLAAPATVILTNLLAPSPSRTSCWASPAYRPQLVAEIRQAPVARAADPGRAGAAGGEQQAGVVGRSVAVDRDPVEGCLGEAGDQGLQRGRRDRRVGDDKAQHGGHVWRDMPEPLAMPPIATLTPSISASA